MPAAQAVEKVCGGACGPLTLNSLLQKGEA